MSKKAVVPLPSIENYPIDTTPDWILGIDENGERVRILAGSGPSAGSVTLDGVISGSGVVDGTITTSFASPLNLPLGGGRITGLLDEFYSDDQAVRKDSITAWLATTLSDANTYTDEEITTLKDYTDAGLATTLNEALTLTSEMSIVAVGDVTGILKLDDQDHNLTIANKSIELTGPVTGIGTLGGTIATTLAYPLDAGSQRLINVGVPTLDTDGATKKYVDDNSGGGPADAFASTVTLPTTVQYKGTHPSGAYSRFYPPTPAENYQYTTYYYADQYFFISRYEHYQAGSARYSMLYSNNQVGGTEWFYSLHTAASQGGASLIRFYTTLDMQWNQIINAPTATEENHVVNLGCLREHMAKIENRLEILEKSPIPSERKIPFFKKLFKRRKK